MLNPLGLVLLLALPLLFLLHYLKTRRREVRIASLKLWREAIGETEEGAKSKFRLNLDLVLLAVAILLVSAAAVLPFVSLGESSKRPVLIVVDCSASMAESGAWEQATKAVSEAIGGFDDDIAVTLCEAAPTPRLLCRNAKPDKALKALKSMQIYDAPGDLKAAAMLAQATDLFTRPWVLTDSVPSDFIPADITTFGKPLDNVGFVSAARVPAGLFLAVANYSLKPWHGFVTIGDGKTSSPVTEIALQPMERLDLLLELDTQMAEGTFLTLDPPTGLAADDHLYLSAKGTTKVRVALAGDISSSPGKKGILGALDSIGGLNIVRVEGNDFPSDIETDIYIGVRTPIPTLDKPGLYFLPQNGWGVTRSDGDWSGDLAVCEPPHSFFVGESKSKISFYMKHIAVGANYAFESPSWQQVLASGQHTALACRGNVWVAAFTPEPVADSWVRDPSFALFMARLIETAAANSFRQVFYRTSLNHPNVGFHEGAAFNLLSDDESNLLARSTKKSNGPATGKPISTAGSYGLGFILMSLALAAYITRMFISAKAL